MGGRSGKPGSKDAWMVASRRKWVQRGVGTAVRDRRGHSGTGFCMYSVVGSLYLISRHAVKLHIVPKAVSDKGNRCYR